MKGLPGNISKFAEDGYGRRAAALEGHTARVEIQC